MVQKNHEPMFFATFSGFTGVHRDGQAYPWRRCNHSRSTWGHWRLAGRFQFWPCLQCSVMDPRMIQGSRTMVGFETSLEYQTTTTKKDDNDNNNCCYFCSSVPPRLRTTTVTPGDSVCSFVWTKHSQALPTAPRPFPGSPWPRRGGCGSGSWRATGTLVRERLRLDL